MDNFFYGLDHHPIEPMEAELLLRDADRRRIARSDVGDLWVSTVFLVLDHGLGRSPAPVLYETMVFDDGQELPEFTEQYYTRESALAGHGQIVAELRYLINQALDAPSASQIGQTS